MKSHNYIAVDLGASSGRVIVSHNDKLDEVIRFRDYLKKDNGVLYWDIDYIYSNIVEGIKKAVKKYKHINSLSIDSWGVDYALLNGKKLISPVYSYRYERTDEAIKNTHKLISFKKLYKITGIQFAKFNSIYQLVDDFNRGRLTKATDFLHIPEYLSYLLTGNKVKEYTMASTTGMLDLKTGEFSKEIIEKLNLPKKLFKKLVKPGEVIGLLKEDIAKEVGANFPVVTCASHDTGSAFEALDVGDDSIILSSGTWSLIGVKLKEGNNSNDSFNSNFTNEGGVNYIRYLKNIMGMWLYNQTRKGNTDNPLSYEEIDTLVSKSNYHEVFDVNDPSLLSPSNMKEAIKKLLKNKPPKNDGDIYRSIYYSLATSYLHAKEELEHNLNKKFKQIYIVGGGAKNLLLNQIIEKVTKLKVVALPIEATAIGNIKVQKMCDKIKK